MTALILSIAAFSTTFVHVKAIARRVRSVLRAVSFDVEEVGEVPTLVDDTRLYASGLDHCLGMVS